MENKELTSEQLNEVNARVKEIVETFREGLCNSSAFDYGNYWTQGLSGNSQMSDACKYVYDTKKRIVEMLDKEMMLVEQNDVNLYYQKKRKAKEKIIDAILNIARPYLRGREDEHRITQRAVNLAEFAIGSGEDLNELTTRGKHVYSEREFFRSQQNRIGP